MTTKTITITAHRTKATPEQIRQYRKHQLMKIIRMSDRAIHRALAEFTFCFGCLAIWGGSLAVLLWAAQWVLEHCTVEFKALWCMLHQRAFYFPGKVGVVLSSKKKPDFAIFCDRGVTWVRTPNIDALYRYKWYFVKLNPKMLFPQFRRDNRKYIVVNGRRKGVGEVRSGCIPLSEYDARGSGIGRVVKNFLKRRLGLCCRKYERGYILVKISKWKYIVLQRTTERGLLVCEVYNLDSEKQVGTFTFNPDFTEVHTYCGVEGMLNTMHVIIGYVADSNLFSMAAEQMTKKIKIIM